VRTRTTVIVSIAILLVAARAEADGALRIETLEERTWSAAVSALQHDRNSEGKTIHVIVRENDGARATCGTYKIGLDVASAEAFQSEGCDPSNNATALRLVHRSALFEHGDPVPKPRQPHIVAQRTQTGEAQGGASSSAESAVDCAVSVKPFIRDLENGGRIDLVPGRYGMKTRNGDIVVKPTEDGWVFHAPKGTSSVVEYYVTDLKKGEVVLNDRVSMNCSVHTSSGSGLPPPSDPMTAPTIAPTETLQIKPYEPPSDSDNGTESEHRGASGSWQGYSVTANFGTGSAFMRGSGVRFANNSHSTDLNSLGMHDSAGPVLLASIAYERPGMYGSVGAAAAMTAMNNRTLWNFGVSSVVAGALHLGDVSLYLGPDVQIGNYQVSADSSQTLTYGSPLQFSLGGAAGGRYHVRNEKTGKVDYVLGLELVAPVAGPSPWFLTAQIAFGSGK
jgi:hypothetical protein